MKKKIVKIIAASGLAVMMGVGVLCGTIIPMSGSAASSMTSQSSQSGLAAGHNDSGSATAAQLGDSAPNKGLITPKEDDQIIGISDNGLNIKWANSLTSESAGFPYFVTNDGVKNYCWVVIGQNVDSSLSSQYSYKIEEFDYLDFCNTLDQSPAGVAIHPGYLTRIQYNDTEIPKNSVLCVLNTIVSEGIYNLSSVTTYNYNNSSPIYGSNYSDSQDIAVAMEGYYDNQSLGLTGIISKIKPVSLETYSRVWGTWATYTTDDQHIYPLGVNSSSTFYYGTYLSDENMKLDSSQWLRGTYQTSSIGGLINLSYYCDHAGYMKNDGTLGDARVNSSLGYRPAFCLQIL